MSLLTFLLEGKRNNLTAVIITGNPKYIKGNKLANNFYKDIGQYLMSKGYRVSYDPGEAYTQPKDADLWIAHSRGNDRLRFAGKNVKKISLGVEDDELVNVVNHPLDNSLVRGTIPDKYHFIFTDEMKAKIDEITKEINED